MPLRHDGRRRFGPMSLCPFGASVCLQIGWMEFTDAVIKVVNEQLKGVVFILWGKYVVRCMVYAARTR